MYRDKKKNSFFDVCHVSNFKTEFCSLKSDALYSTKQSDNLCLMPRIIGLLSLLLKYFGFFKEPFLPSV